MSTDPSLLAEGAFLLYSTSGFEQQVPTFRAWILDPRLSARVCRTMPAVWGVDGRSEMMCVMATTPGCGAPFWGWGRRRTLGREIEG